MQHNRNLRPNAPRAERYREIFEHSNDAIFLIDPRSDRILEANPRAGAMLGYTHEELLATPISAVHPNEMPRMLAFTEAVLREGHGWTDELCCRTKAGEFLPAEISASVVEMAGQICVIAMVRNIAERKRMEAALRDSEERLSRVLDSAMDAIIVVDEKLRITLFNEAAESAFRCPAAVTLGTPLRPLISDRFKDLIEVSVKEFTHSGWKKHYMWAEALTAFRADGEPFAVDISLSPFEHTGARYLTLILRDVTVRRQAQHRIRGLRSQNARLQALVRSEAGPPDIIGVSAPIRRLFRDIEQVATTDATVLILGETGTGKELIARALHQESRRQDKPLVTLNCAALSAGLVESELFGHEKGAFTGALARKLGRFELADQGTLFLDEIGELPLDLQAKLLRVLQEGEFERVGGVSTRKVDVRVIAATNRELVQTVRDGKFREDLFYRLNVFPVHVPPLRERREDIDPLVKYFVAKYSRKIGRPIDTISPQVLDTLLAYGWPGNVRELEHVIERGVILCHDGRLDLGPWLPQTPTGIRGPTLQTLETRERDYIVEVLEHTGWKVSGTQGAAQVLGLKPTTLEARMHKLGIRRRR